MGDMMENNIYLQHHGVKGQHWGVRKERWKQTRREYVKSNSVPKRVGKFLLAGPSGAYAYNSLRASGSSRGKAIGQHVGRRAVTWALSNFLANSGIASLPTAYAAKAAIDLVGDIAVSKYASSRYMWDLHD